MYLDICFQFCIIIIQPSFIPYSTCLIQFIMLDVPKIKSKHGESVQHAAATDRIDLQKVPKLSICVSISIFKISFINCTV